MFSPRSSLGQQKPDKDMQRTFWLSHSSGFDFEAAAHKNIAEVDTVELE